VLFDPHLTRVTVPLADEAPVASAPFHGYLPDLVMATAPTPAQNVPIREQAREHQQNTTPNEIRGYINEKNVAGLEAAIPRIKPRVFRPSPWHACLNLICMRWFEDEVLQRKLVRLLLSHGGKENETDRRLLLDTEIKTVGELEVEPGQFDDKVATIIAEEAFRSFPDLAWSSTPTTNRTVFHTAAEEGACRIILLAKETVASNGKSLSHIIRQTDRNGRTALELAVEKGKGLAVNELLRLDGSQLDANPDAGRIITSAVEGGMTSIVKTLVTNRFSLLTEGMFRKAIASTKVDTSTKLEILKFLIDSIPPESGLLRESTFLHHAVRKGQVKIVELLIKRCPELTTSYEKANPPNSKERSVLYYNTTEAREDIRDLIVPVIIERNAISVIRELFADTLGGCP
jgi:ankyrin repeat protein